MWGAITLLCVLLLTASCVNRLFPKTPRRDAAIEYMIMADDGPATGRIAVIFPGLNDDPVAPPYQTIGRYYRQVGVTPVWVDVNWKTFDLSLFADAGRRISADVAQRYPGAEISVFGFSIGGALALKIADMDESIKVILCSPSPVFLEDIVLHSPPLRWLLNARTAYPANELYFSGNTTGNHLDFLYAEHESRIISEKIIAARARTFPESRLVIVQGAKHDIGGEAYLNAIEEAIHDRYN